MKLVNNIYKFKSEGYDGINGEVNLYLKNYDENEFSNKEDFIDYSKFLLLSYLNHTNKYHNYDFINFFNESVENTNSLVYKNCEFKIDNNIIYMKQDNFYLQFHIYGCYMINDCLIYPYGGGLFINNITNNKQYFYFQPPPN